MPAPKASWCRCLALCRERIKYTHITNPRPWTGRRRCIRRARRVQTCRRACADAPVCLLVHRAGRLGGTPARSPPWHSDKMHALHQMALPTHPHRERAPPRRFMKRFRFPLRSAMLRKDKYTQVMNPTPWNRTVPMSSACEACADVSACVYGLGNVPACEPCRQAIEARARARPPLADKKAARYAPKDIANSLPPRARTPRQFTG